MSAWNLFLFCSFVFYVFSDAIKIDTENFKYLVGTCPSTVGEDVDLKTLNGKWYTHGVVGNVSPLSYLNCPKRTFTIMNDNEGSSLKFEFKLPYFSGSYELLGAVNQKKKDKFEITYSDPSFGDIQETNVILQYFPSGAMLMWTCLDFKLFHFVTYSAVTKYPDIRDPRIPEKSVWEVIEAKIKKLGFFRSIMVVNQTNCE